ncbi:hypothetical protein MUK42_01869 [Musa troglodytarum]|uniref:Secreted protein n=1 Tax=Musa troglodytarum TaxID=320322 RepID=A0A9E7EJD9_9LILI|nr:hypothetical protein MUK42_01869 [Musa troglodytarum]
MRDGKDWRLFSSFRVVTLVQVCPICQLRGVMCQEVERRPSLAVTRNDNDCPVKSTLVCQRCPQFLDMAVHPTLFPLICMLWTSPAPATFHTRTRRK